ncbi:MAG: hypothetical protein EPN21_02410 [Methylococcaceae bacterium]|nr:MAG: hypothetical protein EPN21_02410 [Methylococcaceae bacterium]
MKHKNIAAAVALAVAAYSNGAMALAPTVSPDITLYIGGATAQDYGIGLLITELCSEGTLDTYLDLADTSKPGKSYSAYFCKMKSSKITGLTVTDPKVLIYKRSAGGSAMGVSPLVGGGTAIDFMSIANSNCTLQSGKTDVWGCTVRTGTADLQSKKVDMGVSDVNPELFLGDNTPDGFDPVNKILVNKQLVVSAAAALVFGVPVTKDLRDTLQKAEVAQGSLGADCVGDETESCMPSLSKAQVASLYAGRIKTWDSFKVNGQPLSDYAASTAPSNNLVHICRRVDGSGTQAVANEFYLNNPCSGDYGATLPPAAKDSTPNKLAVVSNPLTGPVVIENSGSGDVEVCLNDFNEATVGLGANHPNPAAGYKAWAVGVQSLEKNATLSNKYRFVKVDGVAPTLENVANGSYLHWAEQTFQWRKTNAGGPSGNKLKIIQKIASEASKPSIVAQLNVSFKHSFGDSGYLVTPQNATPDADGVFDANNPVNPYSHSFNGKVDNCLAPTVYGKSNGASAL